MSAAQLRRAAKTLREHTQSLPSTMTGRWFTRSGPVIADDGTDVGMLVLEPYNPKDDAPLMSFVALMHPPVALALADWLDQTARHVDARIEAEQHVGIPADTIKQDDERRAEDVARAIIREGDDDA